MMEGFYSNVPSNGHVPNRELLLDPGGLLRVGQPYRSVALGMSTFKIGVSA